VASGTYEGCRRSSGLLSRCRLRCRFRCRFRCRLGCGFVRGSRGGGGRGLDRPCNMFRGCRRGLLSRLRGRFRCRLGCRLVRGDRGGRGRGLDRPCNKWRGCRRGLLSKRRCRCRGRLRCGFRCRFVRGALPSTRAVQPSTASSGCSGALTAVGSSVGIGVGEAVGSIVHEMKGVGASVGSSVGADVGLCSRARVCQAIGSPCPHLGLARGHSPPWRTGSGRGWASRWARPWPPWGLGWVSRSAPRWGSVQMGWLSAGSSDKRQTGKPYRRGLIRGRGGGSTRGLVRRSLSVIGTRQRSSATH
jgi:hypothetical protein